MKRKPVQRDDAGEALALDVLGWLVAEGDRLYPFLNATGLTPATLRETMREPAFLAGVLDHVMGDEAVLVACARGLDVAPERIAAAWRRLSPPAPEDV
ncbi:DUF3572 domain-containing protein [uncultured Methylobacterium sp.]|uniref:DUF3572 domain-containing protein n=1 Tax=uncultured Methylobacterium sp. TaxID=157278 RepID=UPI0035CA0BA1